MKRTSTLKRGNGFKKVVGNSFKKSPLKRSSFKITPTDIQKEVIKADSKFSKFIINRDDKHCLRCGSTQMLTCSHFHGRANYATRFEPLNCVTFCMECHVILESKKKEGMEYHQFMLKWLGEEQFFILEKISKMSISKSDSLVLVNNLLSKVDVTNDIKY